MLKPSTVKLEVRYDSSEISYYEAALELPVYIRERFIVNMTNWLTLDYYMDKDDQNAHVFTLLVAA